MKKNLAFTVVEMLIATLIIGVLAAIILPSLIELQTEARFIAGLKKATNAINDAISLNITKGYRSAFSTTQADYSNSTNMGFPLFLYLQKAMDVNEMSEVSKRSKASNNSEFYTKDNMRFEFPRENGGSSEFSGLKIGDSSTGFTAKEYACGTSGLDVKGVSTAVRDSDPCVILVDVNGSKQPNQLTDNVNGISDMFLIIVTDKNAFPYGEVAQKAYYEARKTD